MSSEVRRLNSAYRKKYAANARAHVVDMAKHDAALRSIELEREEARLICAEAKDGQPISTDQINWALKVLGDLEG